MFIIFRVFFTWLLLAYYPNLIISAKWLQKTFFYVLITITQPTMEGSTFDCCKCKHRMLLNIMLGFLFTLNFKPYGDYFGPRGCSLKQGTFLFLMLFLEPSGGNLSPH
jgi:hypothetical protein